MRDIITCIAAFAWALIPTWPLMAVGPQSHYPSLARKNIAAAAGYLIEENYEGTGKPAAATEFGTANSRDYDFTTTVIEGSESFDLDVTVAARAGIYWTVASNSTLYVYMLVRFVDQTPSQTTQALTIRDSTGLTDLAALRVTAGAGVLLYANGGDSAASATTLTANTTYHAWLTYVRNGTCELAMSTGNIKPLVDGVGNVYLTKTGGNVANAQRVYVEGSHFLDHVSDKLRASASTIGDNPS